MGCDKPHELLVTAAVRGKLCELIGDDLIGADWKPELFLVGALSLIDAMLDQPMSDVLDDLLLADDLKLALQGEASPLRPVLEFVECYERADWAACAELSSTHGNVETKALDRYTQAVSWATALLKG